MILSIDISPDMSQMASVNNKGKAYIWSLSASGKIYIQCILIEENIC